MADLERQEKQKERNKERHQQFENARQERIRNNAVAFERINKVRD